MIEAAPDMQRESEKEWYFGNVDKERRGPYSFEEVRKYENTPHFNLMILSSLSQVKQACCCEKACNL